MIKFGKLCRKNDKDSRFRVNMDISSICSITTNLFHSFINNSISTKMN